MKKIIFISMIFVSIVFASCTTEIKVMDFSTSKTEFGATFTDFFDPVNLVHSNYDDATIVMDKNTGVLYIWKQWGMSPIYDSDGSVLTKEKWLAKQVERSNE